LVASIFEDITAIEVYPMSNPQRMLRDGELQATKALPTGAGTIYTDGIDLEHDASGVFVADCELLIEAPALAVADLGDGATMVYDVEHSDDGVTYEDLANRVLVQTGAGGAGAAVAEARFRLPSTVKRHIRVAATNSAAGDASDKSVTAGLVF
jgi:hypothetical protein